MMLVAWTVHPRLLWDVLQGTGWINMVVHDQLSVPAVKVCCCWIGAASGSLPRHATRWCGGALTTAWAAWCVADAYYICFLWMPHCTCTMLHLLAAPHSCFSENRHSGPWVGNTTRAGGCISCLPACSQTFRPALDNLACPIYVFIIDAWYNGVLALESL